jgi:hypothetical protein
MEEAAGGRRRGTGWHQTGWSIQVVTPLFPHSLLLQSTPDTNLASGEDSELRGSEGFNQAARRRRLWTSEGYAEPSEPIGGLGRGQRKWPRRGGYR